MPNFSEGYKRLIKGKHPKFLILGNKPYPTDAMGIAFCKDSWDELMKKKCSGYHLLNALGVDLENAKSKYRSPFALFCKMIHFGIFFWNKADIDGLFSLGIEERSLRVVVCGPNAAVCYGYPRFLKLCDNVPFYVPRHPSPQKANAEDVDSIWKIFFGGSGLLIEKLSSIYIGAEELKNKIDDLNCAFSA